MTDDSGGTPTTCNTPVHVHRKDAFWCGTSTRADNEHLCVTRETGFKADASHKQKAEPSNIMSACRVIFGTVAHAKVK